VGFFFLLTSIRVPEAPPEVVGRSYEHWPLWQGSLFVAARAIDASATREKRDMIVAWCVVSLKSF
jgi:hypothetical protein